jgi:hypothetical protein
MMITGARRIPASQPFGAVSAGVLAAQNRSVSGGVSSTRKPHPWENPADGARTAWSTTRLTTAAGTGRSGS